ncbi:chromobox protein homolog 5-like isoform X2 [Halichondria panicea]
MDSSKRQRPEKGYYSYLHNISSADMDLSSMREARDVRTTLSCKSDDSLPEGVFLVERIIHHRLTKGKTEYLVKWAGYSLEQSSWVAKEDVTISTIQ